MSRVDRPNSVTQPEVKLPARDWLLLPLLAVGTVAVFAFSINAIAHRMFWSSATSVDSCLIQTDRATGGRAIPNTVCYQKDPDTKLTEYKFNSCGHRAGMPCAPKTPGTYRIVMLGSSMDFGFSVAQQNTFAALLPAELSSRTGRKVEVYNESMLGEFPRIAARHVSDALAAQPDLILWVLAPRDVRNASTELISDLSPEPSAAMAVPAGGRLSRLAFRFKSTFSSQSVPSAFSTLFQRIVEGLRSTSAGMLLQHALYASQSQYIRTVLISPDSAGNGPDVGFLRTEFNARWIRNLQWFDCDARKLLRQASVAGIPVVVTLIPDRVQSAMISSGNWPTDFNPYRLNKEVSRIIGNDGGTYLDVLPAFQKLNHPERSYFLIDGHPDASGHALVSEVIADALTRGPLPTPVARQSTSAEPKK